LRRSNLIEKYAQCISKRPCEDSLKRLYTVVSINFYTVFLIYLCAVMAISILVPAFSAVAALILQVLLLTVVSVIRPHYNIFEKPRAIVTWFIAVVGSLTIVVNPPSFTLPILLLALLSIHCLIAGVVIVHSLWSQVKRKCNDRTDVVKKMLKEGQLDTEKDALREIIMRYQNLSSRNMSISKEV
jgi:hypothetical protein